VLGAVRWGSLVQIQIVALLPDPDRGRIVREVVSSAGGLPPVLPVTFVGRSEVVQAKGRSMWAGGRGVVLAAVAGVAGLVRAACLLR
jgi:hypothetical protein